MATVPEIDFFSEEFQKDPHPHYRELAARCPIAHSGVPYDWYAMLRETDISALLKDYRMWTSDKGPGLGYAGGGVLVNCDPPQHTSDRRLVNAAFKPADLLAMEPEITTLVDELIDGFVDRGEGDLIELLAMPVPLVVISWLLGLDPDKVMEFRPRADLVISPHADQPPPDPNPRQAELDYFQSMIDARRAAIAAGEDVPDDTLTSLIVTELDGRTLSDPEVKGFMSFLFIAGSQTTTLAIGNLIHRLLERPDLLERVRNDRDLIPNAIEESLRYDVPVHGLFRTNTEPVSLHGVDIPENTKVLCTFAAANLDPDKFPDPYTFDIDRPYDQLKHHYAFGKGIHYCMGAPLARIEIKVALDLVLDRLPNLRLTGEPEEVSAPVLHGVDTLPVAWDVSEGSAP